MLDAGRADERECRSLANRGEHHMRVLRLLACILSVTAFPAAAQPSLVVLAATSLTDVLQEVSDAYARKTDQTVSLTFAGSSKLARQIEAGAAADVFLPADEESMEYVDKRHLIDPASRRALLRNRLVLIAPAPTPIELKIVPGFALTAALGKAKLAMANPEIVAAGRYARYALISLGVWNSMSDRVVMADSVPGTLALVARGEAPLGIVYETDALREKGVRVVDIFPANSHPQIVYPVAVTSKAKAGAARFVEFLESPDGSKIFKQYGFETARK
jgi:molybdate transport system substrate-binding protein